MSHEGPWTGKRARLVRGSPGERFWAKVRIVGDHWVWIGATRKNGTGQFRMGGEGSPRHALGRVAWLLFRPGEPIPPGFGVARTCSRDRCVAPHHHKVASGWHGVQDPALGVRHPHSKLTPAKIRRGRRLRASGLSMLKVAKRLGVSESAWWRVEHGVTWKEKS